MRMQSSRRYVCAFPGRRDGYELPVALHHAGRLDTFITDMYAYGRIDRLAASLPRVMAKKLQARRDKRLPDALVECLWSTTAKEYFRHICGHPHMLTYTTQDRAYSRAARARARKRRANLFLYSSYAWDAFSEHYSHDV